MVRERDRSYNKVSKQHSYLMRLICVVLVLINTSFLRGKATNDFSFALAIGLSSSSKSQTTAAVTSSVLIIMAVAVLILLILLLVFYKRHPLFFKQSKHSATTKESEAGISATNIVYANEAASDDTIKRCDTGN